jgi:hypothetical protein
VQEVRNDFAPVRIGHADEVTRTVNINGKESVEYSGDQDGATFMGFETILQGARVGSTIGLSSPISA